MQLNQYVYTAHFMFNYYVQSIKCKNIKIILIRIFKLLSTKKKEKKVKKLNHEEHIKQANKHR